MSDPFIGQIVSFGFNFAPANWALCQGQLMAISQNETLYTLIGTTFGGDGSTTFGLPNLSGTVPVNQGQSSGNSNYVMGQVSGTESVTLTTNTIPSHTHAVVTSNAGGTTNIPSSSTFLSNEGPGTPAVTTYVPGAPATQTALAGTTIGVSGGSVPHENRQPFLCINYCIALYGVYPSQS